MQDLTRRTMRRLLGLCLDRLCHLHPRILHPCQLQLKQAPSPIQQLWIHFTILLHHQQNSQLLLTSILTGRYISSICLCSGYTRSVTFLSTLVILSWYVSVWFSVLSVLQSIHRCAPLFQVLCQPWVRILFSKFAQYARSVWRYSLRRPLHQLSAPLATDPSSLRKPSGAAEACRMRSPSLIFSFRLNLLLIN